MCLLREAYGEKESGVWPPLPWRKRGSGMANYLSVREGALLNCLWLNLRSKAADAAKLQPRLFSLGESSPEWLRKLPCTPASGGGCGCEGQGSQHNSPDVFPERRAAPERPDPHLRVGSARPGQGWGQVGRAEPRSVQGWMSAEVGMPWDPTQLAPFHYSGGFSYH